MVGVAQVLSGVEVGNALVHRVYARLTPAYDAVFGRPLQAGRAVAIARMGISPGDRVLEIGVGTGLTASLYPDDCVVTGIDLSPAMLEKARERLRRARVRNMRLMEMDAARLRFDDDSFDHVFAPYTISVVPDPVKVVREMRRVCRAGGRIVLLNHFRSTNRVVAALERALSPLTVHVGFRADLSLPAFLAEAGLQPESVEKVNVPRIWTLVTCRK